MSNDAESISSHGDADDTPREYQDEFNAARTASRRIRKRPAHVEQFTAIIRNSPCASNITADYTDARYYLNRAVQSPGLAVGSALSARVDELSGVAQCLTATNLAELNSGTHLLAAGTVVQVFALHPRAGPKVFVFNQPPVLPVVVKITGAANGGGKYVGRILGGLSNATAAANLAMPEGMQTPAADNALILNAEEDGVSGHRLAIPSYAVGQIVGIEAAMTIVTIRGALGSTAGGITLGDGTAGGVAPDSSSWSKARDGTPVSVWVQSRTLWDSTGGVLYAYLRALSFDARGSLVSVSGENQIIVDTPTSCG